MPLASLPMMLAVAGATSSRSMSVASAMCSMSALAPRRELIGDHRPPRDRLERHRPDEPRRRARHDRRDVVAALLQPARDLDRLVGADAAGDAEGDERPISLHLGVVDWLALLDLALADFLLRERYQLLCPSPGRAAAQQLPRARAGDDDEFERVRAFPVGHSWDILSHERVTILRPATHDRSRARSASTIARSRSTHGSSSSLTTT